MSAFDDYLNAKPAGAAAPSFDAYLAAPAAASAVAAPASPAAPVVPAKAAPTQADAAAADLAAGGASPDTLANLLAIGRAGAHGIGSMLGNAANVVEKGVASGLNAIPGVRDTALARAAANTAQSDVAAQSAADQQFSNTATPGEKAVAFVAPLALPVGQVAKGGTAIANGIRSLPAMSGVAGRLIGSGVGNAVVGAGMSTGAPIDPSKPYWPQVASNAGIGAGLGVGLPVAANAVGSAVAGARNVLRPVLNPDAYVGEGLANAVGDQAGAVAQNIRSAQQLVPGSLPTTAQVAGSPVLLQTEKASANMPAVRTAIEQRALDNNAARWDVINSVARTPSDLDAAVAAREAAAGPAYEAARAATYPVDQSLETLMQRPAMQDALARGVAIAHNEGNQGFAAAVQPQAAQYANVQTGGTGFNGQPLFQQVLTRPAQPGQPAQISGDVLHYLKLGLDDLQQSAQQNTRLGPFQRNAINTAQRDFLGWLDNASPDYAQARQAYAANSPPVNTMQAGQEIANRLAGFGRGLNVTQQPAITSGTYATALSQALRNQQFGIDPAAQQALENVGRDLQRSTISNSMRTAGGSDTAYNLAAQGWLARNLYGPTFGGATGLGKAAAAAGTALSGHPVAALGVLGASNRIGQAVGNRLQQRLSTFLLDPDALLPYLDAQATTPTVNVTQQALAAALKRNVLPLAIRGSTGP